MKYPIAVYDEMVGLLYQYTPDRIYPYDFENIKSKNHEYIKSDASVELDSEEGIYHKKAIKVKDIKEDNKLIFRFDKKRKLTKAHFCDIVLQSKDKFNNEKVEIGFCDNHKGILPIQTIDAELNNDNAIKLHLELFEANNESDSNEEFTDIESVYIKFKSDISQVWIGDLVFRNIGETYTLEDLDEYIAAGYNIVERYFSDTNIPTKLLWTANMMSAAYAWYGKFQQTGEKQENESYGQNLKKTAINAIKQYLEEAEMDGFYDIAGNMGFDF